MGTLKTNYHTHNALCNHAVGDASSYVKKAIELGYEEIGLSDHDPIPESFMNQKEYEENLCYRNMKENEFYDVYLPQVNKAKEEYSNDIKIYTGLECEYLEEHNDYYKKLKENLDYLNLGVHFFKDKNNNIISSYHGITYKNVLEYADACVKGIESGLFKILVHPDLFMFDYQNINGERAFDEFALEASKRIIECAIKHNIYLELNVNGLANSRKYNHTDWLYPYYDFWKLASKYSNLKIIIGIDAHNPLSLISQDIDDVKEFAKRLNLNVLDRVEF